MRNILLSIATEPRPQIAGRQFIGRRFELLSGDTVVKETPVLMEDSVRFVDVEAGMYQARVSDIAVDGSVLGETLLLDIEVTPDGAGNDVYPAAVGLSYTLE